MFLFWACRVGVLTCHWPRVGKMEETIQEGILKNKFIKSHLKAWAGFFPEPIHFENFKVILQVIPYEQSNIDLNLDLGVDRQSFFKANLESTENFTFSYAQSLCKIFVYLVRNSFGKYSTPMHLLFCKEMFISKLCLILWISLLY